MSRYFVENFNRDLTFYYFLMFQDLDLFSSRCYLFVSLSVNPLSANPTKWSHSNNSPATANELFGCVWPFCGVGAWRVNTFTRLPSFAFHLETSHLIYSADQMTGFYIKSNNCWNELIIASFVIKIIVAFAQLNV